MRAESLFRAWSILILGQRKWLVAEGTQIGNQIDPFYLIRNAGNSHRNAGRCCPGREKKSVQVLIRPHTLPVEQYARPQGLPC